MPHQCAHWFAMTPPPLSLRGAKRRGNPHLLRQHKTMRKYLRQIRRSCEFALSAAYCSVLLQGERIAAPVCALVRNDTSPPVIARSEATWQSVFLRRHKTMRKYLRQIRRSCEFALSAAYCSVLLQGERIATPVCALVRNDMQKTDGLQRLQGVVRNDTSPPVIARSEATWQSVFLRRHKTMRKYLRQIRRSCEFALSAAYCSVLLQGERIATPVCALVRNDKLGRYAHTRARPQCTAFLPGDADCHTSVRTGSQ